MGLVGLDPAHLPGEVPRHPVQGLVVHGPGLQPLDHCLRHGLGGVAVGLTLQGLLPEVVPGKNVAQGDEAAVGEELHHPHQALLQAVEGAGLLPLR